MKVGLWNWLWEPECNNTSDNIRCKYKHEIEFCKHTRNICTKPKDVVFGWVDHSNKGCVFRDKEYAE